MQETDIAYCAGLVDGEGCIRVKKSSAYKCQGRKTPGYHPAIQIRMVDGAAIKFIAETLGGWYYKEKAHVAKGRPLFCYQATDKRAETILRTLLPYLKVKRESAENVLRLCDLKAKASQHRTKLSGYKTFPHSRTGKPVVARSYCLSDDFVAQCESLFQRSGELNRVGLAA